MRTRFCIALAVASLLIAPATEAQGPDEPYRFFRDFKAEVGIAPHSG
jgi:hypothetical protein